MKNKYSETLEFNAYQIESKMWKKILIFFQIFMIRFYLRSSFALKSIESNGLFDSIEPNHEKLKKNQNSDPNPNEFESFTVFETTF
jgi:hypothetical protein